MALFRVRLATRRDLHLLVRHRRGMWESMGERDGRALDEGDRVYRRWARQRLTSKRLVGFIAEDAAGHAVASGCIWLRPAQPRPGFHLRPVPYLMSMFTEPDYRGRGLARRIVRESIRWCRDRGYPRLTLHASTQGRSLYRSRGFQRTWEMRIKLIPSKRGSSRKRRKRVTSS
ncbi:MAG TPA: GNAT family N-acetyltransferase [Thermoplasmata archaeon]